MTDTRHELAIALETAIDLAEEGWEYAGDYFNEKWDSKARIERLRKVLLKWKQSEQQIDNVDALKREVAMLRSHTDRVVALKPGEKLDPGECTHNVEIDPDTGECGTCGEVLP